MKRIKELVEEYQKVLEIYDRKASELQYKEVTPGFQSSKAPSTPPNVEQPGKHSKKQRRK